MAQEDFVSCLRTAFHRIPEARAFPFRSAYIRLAGHTPSERHSLHHSRAFIFSFTFGAHPGSDMDPREL